MKVREVHPAWGPRKIAAVLSNRRILSAAEIPSPSTIGRILQRHGLIDNAESRKHKPFTRFERERPNQLWQMDFKGYFPAGDGFCHPLTVLDDHSRYNLCLQACSNERRGTVKQKLTAVFSNYGLPDSIMVDNGPPWGVPKSGFRHTKLSVWLMSLGIAVLNSRPLHPQTMGKEERFHRTLKEELLRYHDFRDLAHCQYEFDCFRTVYNLERPHESLGMQVPASRYCCSPRCFPGSKLEIEYPAGYDVRKVQDGGFINFKGKEFRISSSFKGYPVGLRENDNGAGNNYEIYFNGFKVAEIGLQAPETIEQKDEFDDNVVEE